MTRIGLVTGAKRTYATTIVIHVVTLAYYAGNNTAGIAPTATPTLVGQYGPNLSTLKLIVAHCGIQILGIQI
jgi:hypothetical protein